MSTEVSSVWPVSTRWSCKSGRHQPWCGVKRPDARCRSQVPGSGERLHYTRGASTRFAEKWDSAAKKWKSEDPKKQPDLRDGVKYFDENVQEVSEDKKTGLVTLSITWKDPTQAAVWANLLVAQVNEKLRQKALEEAEHNIEYLRNEMTATNIPSLQRAIGTVLESEMQKLLLARGRDEFAFQVIDKAVPPKERIRPRRTIIVAFALMLGGALSCVIVLFRRAVSTRSAYVSSVSQD